MSDKRRGRRDVENDGVKVRTLRSLLDEDIPPRERLLGPWLLERHLSMVYAAAGVGKSMFTMSVALAVGGGGEYLGWEAPEGRGVLLVDGEMDRADLQQRAGMLIDGLPGINREKAGENVRLMARQDQEPGVDYPDLADPEGRQAVLDEVDALKPALVVLDNLSTLVTMEDENAASSFNPVLDLMEELKLRGAACVLVHHSRKGNGGNGTGSYRGTSKMAVTFNSIIELTHPAGVPSRDGTAFDLRWEKYRGLRDGSVNALRVKLGQAVGEHESPRWVYQTNDDERLHELVAMVKTLDYPTQQSLAGEMGVSTGLVSKLKGKAVAEGIITEDCWGECMKQAREVAGEEVEDF